MCHDQGVRIACITGINALARTKGITMRTKTKTGVVLSVIVAISSLGLYETLQAAPKESQRLRGMEGRAFLIDAFRFDENGNPVQFDGGYCYFFNADGEWVDQRWPFGPGTWEQHSVGAATDYSALASVFFPPFGFIELEQEGEVTPASGRGVLQLESITKIYATPPEQSERFLIDVILSIGHEVAANECPPF